LRGCASAYNSSIGRARHPACDIRFFQECPIVLFLFRTVEELYYTALKPAIAPNMNTQSLYPMLVPSFCPFGQSKGTASLPHNLKAHTLNTQLPWWQRKCHKTCSLGGAFSFFSYSMQVGSLPPLLPRFSFCIDYFAYNL
jgi:hypothetical protein